MNKTISNNPEKQLDMIHASIRQRKTFDNKASLSIKIFLIAAVFSTINFLIAKGTNVQGYIDFSMSVLNPFLSLLIVSLFFITLKVDIKKYSPVFFLKEAVNRNNLTNIEIPFLKHVLGKIEEDKMVSISEKLSLKEIEFLNELYNNLINRKTNLNKDVSVAAKLLKEKYLFESNLSPQPDENLLEELIDEEEYLEKKKSEDSKEKIMDILRDNTNKNYFKVISSIIENQKFLSTKMQRNLEYLFNFISLYIRSDENIKREELQEPVELIIKTYREEQEKNNLIIKNEIDNMKKIFNLLNNEEQLKDEA